MPEKEFNLLDEQWIQASNMHGETVALSIKDVFAQAHELKSLAGELPAQDTAILRMLLAVLYSVFPYTDETGAPIPVHGVMDFWKRLWDRGCFPDGVIDNYLSRYYDKFWLFHPERPFWQIAGITKGTHYTAAKLIGELSESNNKTRLFQNRSGILKNSLSYAEAARWLLYLNAYDDTASKASTRDEKFPSPGAGWLGRLGLIHAAGANLFETLLLNFILTDDNSERWETGNAVWELDKPRSGEREKIAMPKSQAELLTLQSRRLLLERTNGAVTGLMLLGGDFFDKEKSFSEQMTIWRKDKKQDDVYNPKRHDSSKQLWRDFTALLTKVDGARQPGIVRWLSELEYNGIVSASQIQLRATSVQYGDKDFFISDTWDDAISINAKLLLDIGDDWVARISREIEVTEQIVRTFGYLASDIAKASGLRSDNEKVTSDKIKEERKRKLAMEEAYFRLDMPFRDWLSAIDPEENDMEEISDKWRRIVKDEIYRLGDELIASAGGQAFIGRKVKIGNIEDIMTAPKAYMKFRYMVSKILSTQKQEG